MSSKNLHWYQKNTQIMAQAHALQDPTQRLGSRTSRFERWVQQGEARRKQMSDNLKQPQALEQRA